MGPSEQTDNDGKGEEGESSESERDNDEGERKEGVPYIGLGCDGIATMSNKAIMSHEPNGRDTS